jgi:hypothetical protein
MQGVISGGQAAAAGSAVSGHGSIPLNAAMDAYINAGVKALLRLY